MIRTIIIDDEQRARETICEIIKLHCEDVQIVGQADSVSSGFEVIKNAVPDVVLLDIQLADGTAFDLLKQFGTVDFKVIFITAYEQYAIEAFRFSALDYILKPIDPDELKKAVYKAQHSLEQENFGLMLNTFLSNTDNISKANKKIVLNTSGSIHIVKVQDIIRCEADRNYTQFYFNDGKKLLVSRTLKEFDEMLHEYGFLRVHQTHLINLDYLERYEKEGYAVMKDKSTLPVSFRKKDHLLKILEEL